MAKRVENIQINDVLAPPPYINKTTNTWWLYDFDSGEYVDTSIRAEGKDGADGRSPYIENGTWWEWNAETGRYEDTGVQADIEVGGVNLIQNGNFFNGLSNWNINSPIETLPETLTIYSGTDLPDGVLSCLKVTATTYGQGVWQNLMNKLELNRTYTLSFLLKKSGSEEFNLYFGHEENIQTREITKTDTWERHIYRFTPTTHQNIVFYANNAATFFITNIQLEKGTVASDFKSGYLEDALKQTAEINGGLILGSIIGARDEQNIVRSYISGLKNNQTAIATGVEGFGTESEKKSIDLRHDGSAKIGELFVDKYGKVELNSRNGAKVFNIIKGDMPTLESLFDNTNKPIIFTTGNPQTATRDFSDTTQSGFSASVLFSSSSFTLDDYFRVQLKFNVAHDSTHFQTEIFKESSLSVINVNDNSTAKIVNLSGGGSLIIDDIFSPGTYLVRVQAYTSIAAQAINSGVLNVSVGWESSNQFYSKATNRTLTCPDGFFSFFNENKYFYLSQAEDVFLKVKGEIDMPGGLGGGRSASSTQEGANLWGKVISASRAGSTVTVYHNIGDLKYTVQVAMHGNSTWYYQNKTANSIQIVCSGSFDFILVRTPY